MGLQKLFKTNDRLETGGVVVDYDGETRIRIARAGGANKRFARMLDKKVKPLRRAIAAGSLTNERANEVVMEVYAETVVLGWETRVHGEKPEDDKWVSGIDPEDAGVTGSKELLPARPENYLKVFKALPDLFADLRQQAESMSLFRLEVDEAAAGN